MIPIPSTLLLGIPQGASSTGTSALPWPNGSLVSAQVLAMDTPELATIMIGSYRIQAKVPPNTPLGQIWLELINRELPAQMKILSEQRALEKLIQQLSENTQAKHPTQAAHASKTMASQHSGQAEPGWPFPPSAQMPFHAHASQDRLFLEQNDDQTPRGMIQQQIDEHHYALHGRLDLEHLGTLFFILEQTEGQPVNIKVRAQSHQSFLALQKPFQQFLDRQNNDDHESTDDNKLHGRLYEGSEPFLTPTDKPGALA